MKKTVLALIAAFALAAIVAFGLSACKPEDPKTKTKTYSVSYETGGGTGTAPETQEYEAGELIVLPANPFEYANHNFTGWKTGEIVYAAGESYTIPEADTVFVAQWEVAVPEVGQPSFSEQSYAYDRLGGGDLELPLDLANANLYYVEVNGDKVSALSFRYDAETKCLVLFEDYILDFQDGEYIVKAITDAGNASAAQCTLTVDNSVKTSFDEQTVKEFRFGIDEGVSFDVSFNGTTVTSLYQNGIKIDETYYTLENDVFTVKSDWLRRYCDDAEYIVELSNHDRYHFTVITNVIFYSDYDVTTIHDTTASNTGMNPLYQYYDNVSIVSAPENSGMEGNVLKFTPNTQPVLYDCNAIMTLRKQSWEATWYAPGFLDGTAYAVSFDYMTEGTSVGDFEFASRSSGYRVPLLLGEKNDGVVHHFSAVLTSEQIGNGIWIWAYFEDGGGSIYLDNYSVTPVENIPELIAEEDYTGYGDYNLTFRPYGMIWELFCDGERVENVAYDAETDTLTVPESWMSALEAGGHTFAIHTPVFTVETEVRVLDDAIARLRDTHADYHAGRTDEIRLYGTFTEGVELVSLKQTAKSYDGGYSGWEFVQTDVNADYADRVIFKTGENDEGHLCLPAEFLDCFWGTTRFVAEFSNGATQEFTIVSDIVLADNMDESLLWGRFDGSLNLGSPLNSGLNEKADGELAYREDGNQAFYVRSTEGAQATAAFTVKFHDHVWEWLRVPTREGMLYRISFDYAISGLEQDSVYFMLTSMGTENKEENFFGSGYTVVNISDYDELRWNLIADGQVHTFDSGWFTYSSQLRLSKIMMPAFTKADNSYVMFDNYKIYESDYLTEGLPDYVKGEGDYSFSSEGYVFHSLTIDGTETDAAQVDVTITVPASALEALSVGVHTLVVTTNAGAFRCEFTVKTEGTAILSETRKEFSFGDESVVLSGEFDKVTLTSAVHSGSHEFDASSVTPTAVSVQYFTVAADSITVSKQLLDILYGETQFTLTFSNGGSVTFTLVSDVIYFTDWDEMYLNQPMNGPNNAYTTQDYTSLSFEENGIEGVSLKYYVFDARELGATTPHNKIMLFCTGWSQNMSYTRLGDSEHDYIVTFDYRVVNSEGKEATYFFGTNNSSDVWTTTALSAEDGTFEGMINGGNEEVQMFGIGCDQVGGVEGCYLLIDNYRVRAVEKG